MANTNQDKLHALTQTANDLVNEVNKLNEGTGRSVDSLSTRVRRNQRVQVIVIASFVLDLVLTVVLAVNISHTDNNTDQLHAITDQLNYNAHVQRKQVLCPLYKIFVDSKSDAGRQAYPKGVKEYDRLFGILEDSYNALQCDRADFQPLQPK